MESKFSNISININNETKRDFETLCDNAGINLTTAVNMLINATLQSRSLPFTFIDISLEKQAKLELQVAFEDLQKESVANGNDNMTMDEINEIITVCRKMRI